MIDERFLKLVRAKIAAENFKKKSLAKKCKISSPRFSEIIHGDRIMPPEVRECLITELELESHIERLEI